MSERSIYLRDQADKCQQHANIVGDARTREELRKLAAVYIARAQQIESKGRLEPPNALPKISSGKRIAERALSAHSPEE